MTKISCIDCDHVADSRDGKTKLACRRFGHEFAPIYECAVDGCGAQADDQTELWICADCQEDFCESHVVDLLDDHAELPICRECGDDICRACAVPGSITDPDVDAPSRCVCLACREEERAA
jgi:hypothetical protein